MKALFLGLVLGILAAGFVYLNGAPLDGRLLAGAVIVAGGVGLGLGLISFARRFT